MCGICGIAVPSGQAVSQEHLQAMTNTMHARGPDARGTAIMHQVGLGHARLKVIDLSDAANQPMQRSIDAATSEQTDMSGPGDGSPKISIVFNGEIYNFRELRDELIENYGYRFTTNSDTEVILQGYRAWGTDLPDRLNGLFAFAIYDERDEKLLLARDRFGTKPLYFCKSGGKFAFASEVRALLQLPYIERELDAQTIFYYLKFSHFPYPSSIIKSIQQVRPGTMLEYTDGKLRTRAFWQPNLRETNQMNDSELVDELDVIIGRAVARQTVADVPLGSFLSGGIDSSLLTAYLAKGSSTPVKTFCIAYDEADFDESYYAKIVADHFKTDHHKIVVKPADLFALVKDLPDLIDQPLADPTLMSSLILAREARKEITVAFSGDGGDELFFGYDHQQTLHKINQVPRSMRHLLGQVSEETVGRKWHRLHKLGQVLQAANDAELVQYFIGTVGPMRLDRLARLLKPAVEHDRNWLTENFSNFNSLEFNQKIQAAFLQTFLIDTCLAKSDRTSMAFSLEARVPLLDNELVDFALDIPLAMKYQGGRKKHLLRQLARRHLPEAICKRKKQGFSIPVAQWLRTDLRWLLDEFLSAEKLADDELLDSTEVRRLVDGHCSGKENHSHLLWSLLTLQMWRARYL